MQAEPTQTTLELGVPLSEVTFCVVDLETTGGSPIDDAITEIGAVKYRGGERLGSFRSLVDPRRPIPPYVAHLTGIDDRLVSGEPPIEQVLPSFLEFFGGSVFVAHNAGFDFGFLNASCGLLDYPTLPGPPVCTARLARRVVWPDVPNVKLADALELLPDASEADAPCARRRGGLRRGAARPARPRWPPGHPHPGRSRGSLEGSRTPELRQDPARRRPPPRAGRLPLPGPRRAGALRRQGQRPPHPGEVVLLRRRAQEDREPARRGPVGRGHPVRRRARGPRRRGAPDPASRAQVQPAWEDLAPRRLPRPRSHRRVAPPEGRATRPSPAKAGTTSVRSAPRRGLASPRRRSRRPCRSAGAPPRWASRPGSRPAPSPTWADASPRATGASIPSVTESSSGGSPPP